MLGDDAALELLDFAWELGVRVFDSALSYGRSEALLGRWATSRGVKPTLSTKVGYGIPGVPDWTQACIAQGIERALNVLQTSRIEVVHLHSCPGRVALEGGVHAALADALRTGKMARAAYAGENEDLDQALSSGLFSGVQLSVSVWDQGSRELRLRHYADRGLLVLVKRPLAGAPWNRTAPGGPDDVEYVRRHAALALETPAEGWDSFALRFSAFTPGVSSVLVGTTSALRLSTYARALARGPLPEEEVARVVRRWHDVAQGWRGVV